MEKEKIYKIKELDFAKDYLLIQNLLEKISINQVIKETKGKKYLNLSSEQKQQLFNIYRKNYREKGFEKENLVKQAIDFNIKCLKEIVTKSEDFKIIVLVDEHDKIVCANVASILKDSFGNKGLISMEYVENEARNTGKFIDNGKMYQGYLVESVYRKRNDWYKKNKVRYSFVKLSKNSYDEIIQYLTRGFLSQNIDNNTLTLVRDYNREIPVPTLVNISKLYFECYTKDFPSKTIDFSEYKGLDNIEKALLGKALNLREINIKR